MNIIMKIFAFIVLMFIFISSSLALSSSPVTIKAEVSQAKIKIDEELIFKITVKAKKEIAITIPEVGNSIQGLRIVEFADEKPKSDSDDNNYLIYQKWYKLKSDFSGSYILPAVTLNYNYNQQAATSKTADIFVEVVADSSTATGAANATPTNTPSSNSNNPNDSNNSNDIRDIKNIESIPMKWSNTLIFIVVVIILIVLAVIAALIYNKRKKAYAATLPPIPPADRAIREINKLRAEQVIDQITIKNPKLYHFTLSQIIRTYLEEEFSFKATDMTLEEIKSSIDSLNEVKNEYELKKELLMILEGCDFVKFTDMEIERSLSVELSLKAISFVKKIRPTPPSQSSTSSPDSNQKEESVI
ncbi:MAG: BatD family protein [Oligoflexia bacterium]|nr:BatD family protein [Oligoflexia bacterium]